MLFKLLHNKINSVMTLTQTVDQSLKTISQAGYYFFFFIPFSPSRVFMPS